MSPLEKSSLQKMPPWVLEVLKIKDAFGASFIRSRRGNLWLRWRGYTLTVFYRKSDAKYGTCIAGPEGSVSFSLRSYDTAEDAIADYGK